MPTTQPTDPFDALMARLDWCPGTFNDDIGIGQTREGIEINTYYAVETIPLNYATNTWLPNDGDDREPRSEGIWVGLSGGRVDQSGPQPRIVETIVLAFHGKDVHSGEMTAEQARNLAEVLLAHADYLDAAGRS
jgi:hypothetical protein